MRIPTSQEIRIGLLVLVLAIQMMATSQNTAAIHSLVGMVMSQEAQIRQMQQQLSFRPEGPVVTAKPLGPVDPVDGTPSIRQQ